MATSKDWPFLQEANMTDDKKNEGPKSNPDLKDVEAGSDADATPVPDVGTTPPDPNKDKPD